MFEDLAIVVICIALAAVYAAASLGKRRDFTAFVAYLTPLVGGRGRVLGAGLLMFEAVLVLTLLVGVAVEPVSRLAGVLSVILLLAATAGGAVLNARGVGSRCNCFGVARPSSLDADREAQAPAWVALRNAVLIGASAWLAEFSVGTMAAVIVAVPVIVAAGLQSAIWRYHRGLERDEPPTDPALVREFKTLLAHSWWLNGEPRPMG